ncbi:hypothetical protein G6L67_14785 [Agrobacterium tumefaciens]|uniref:Uncharacterized protein n=1 Tax=Agrobacterium tumefaciens str. Kerr 14 TaxID=1183424 RepID=A0A1S7QX50_AGRTU|nr:hypothetical protein [Agrobacterium tumefaciens]AYM82779.1 hypothetical protein At12D1_28940 [Agrobacterium tumefaciens]NTE93123.1 hypothetical protein [Agrobacterium tumefaciens]CUX43411.1 conserved hypothetical protein [Agrobacterium tumefaciens str. Kerr 14]
MADSEDSRTLPKILCASEFSERGCAEGLPNIINRRNLLPVAASIMPSLLDETAALTVAGPFNVKEIWVLWFERYQRRRAAERESCDLEARLLKETGGRPCVIVESGDDASSSGFLTSFADIREQTPRIGANAAANARRELRKRRQAWNGADERIGYSTSVVKAEEIAAFEGIAGRILISLQPRHMNDIAAKLHYIIATYDPNLGREEAPWPYLRCMLRDLIQPQWAVIDPQSRIRWLRPKRRKKTAV